MVSTKSITFWASVEVLQVKSLSLVPTISFSRVPVQVLVPLLLMQLPDVAPGKAAEQGSPFMSLVIRGGDSAGLLVSGFRLGQSHLTMFGETPNRSLSLIFPLSLFQSKINFLQIIFILEIIICFL